MHDAAPRVLVVDDDREVLASLTDIFTSEGYLVAGAEDGAQALAMFRSFDPAVVVTDLRMPVMDGRHLLWALRKVAPSVPVVVVTGDPLHAAPLSLEGAFDVVEKPVSLARLISVVGAARLVALRLKAPSA